MTIDIGKAFTYPTEDQGWMGKVGIGSLMFLVSCLFVPMFIAMGYAVRTLRTRVTGDSGALPAWDDWGGMLTKGLMLWLISVIYGLVPAGLFFVGFGSMIASFVMAAIGQESGADLGGLAALGGGAVMLVLGSLGILLLLVVAILSPMLMLRYAITDDFGSAFQFGEILSGIKANVTDYVIILAVALGCNLVLSTVSSVIPLLGIVVAVAGGFYVQLVVADLLAQYYRNNMSGAVGEPYAAELPTAAP